MKSKIEVLEVLEVLDTVFVPILLLWLLCSGGCAVRAENEQVAGLRFETYDGSGAAIRAMESAVVQCANPEQCPAGVGQLIIRSGATLLRCTAFVVGPRVAMTNSHCIPNDLRRTNASFSGRGRIVFPLNRGGNRSEIRSVLEASEISEVGTFESLSGLDYALLSIDPVDPSIVLRTSIEGVGNLTPMSVYKVDPGASGVHVASLVRAACDSQFFVSGMYQGFSPFSPTIYLPGCTTISGNSGSPVVDQSGVVRAILYGGPSIGVDRDEGVFGVASNLACIPSLRAGSSIPNECRPQPVSNSYWR